MDPLALQQIPVPERVVTNWPAPVLALLGASMAGVVAQGGFYLPGRILVTALALVAFVLAIHSAGLRRIDAGPVLPTVATIALWALLRAATAGGFPVAAGICATLATLFMTLTVTRRIGSADRFSLASGLVGLGVLVALTGWAGVAWRIDRWAVLVESTLWRGASTLTYPNAAAAVLAVTALLALGLLLAEPDSLVRALVFYLLLAGLAATLSRAGLIAFAAGVLVFLFSVSVRQTLRHLIPAGLGAAVALAGIVPSFPAAAQPQPLPAVCGLLIGGLIAVPMPKLRGRRLAAAWALLSSAATGALVLVFLRRPEQFEALLHRRATFASQGRSGALRSALEQVAAHPLAGTGPGRARFFWLDFEGKLVASRWVHNEYLQWFVDLGAIGFVLLAALGTAVVLLLRRGRATGVPASLWTGAVAAAVALAVHSAFDFLWELAVIPLLFGVLVGIAGPVHSEESAPSMNGEEQP